MDRVFLYLDFLKNYIKFNFFLKNSKKFYIRGKARISGCKMISLGDNFAANNFLRLEVFGSGKDPKLIIGNNVSVGEFVHIGVVRKVELGDGVLLGSRILITDHNHGNYSGKFQSSPDILPKERAIISQGEVKIGKNVWIGDGAVILPGSNIGDGSVIGANSVVSGKIPKNVIIGGIPGKIIKAYDEETGAWKRIEKL